MNSQAYDTLLSQTQSQSVMMNAIAEWESRFRLPSLVEAARLAEQYQARVSKALSLYAQENSKLLRAMESMRTPWLDELQRQRSVDSFATVQRIGATLSRSTAFGDPTSSALRSELGDWRDTITWPPEIATDLAARSAFYAERGFNTALTDLPSEAFEETIALARLRVKPPQLIVRYGSPVPILQDEEAESALIRTNQAHDWLLRLETQLRSFIDAVMTEAFGEKWPLHKLPNRMHDMWTDKREKAKKATDRDFPLISYADFTEYVPIICKRDNWKLFAPFFVREDTVRESFQRLHQIRLDTMHARPITKDDELLLYVEVKRLTRAMKKPIS